MNQYSLAGNTAVAVPSIADYLMCIINNAGGGAHAMRT